jgi:hypothetical protein
MSDDEATGRMHEHIDRQMEAAMARLEQQRLEQQRQQREAEKKVQDARRAEFAKLPAKDKANVIREHVERTGTVPDLAHIRYLMELGRPDPGSPGVTSLPGAPAPDRDPARAQKERDARSKERDERGKGGR